MRKGDIKSVGQIKQEKKDLQHLTEAYSRIGPEGRQQEGAGAVLITFFRMRPEYLQHHEGRVLMQTAIDAVRGREWAATIWPEPVSISERQMLSRFRGDCDKVWPPGDLVDDEPKDAA